MLFKALQYFWVKLWGGESHLAGASGEAQSHYRLRFWRLERNRHITRISGETYWLYRIHLQVALTGMAALGFIGTEFLPGARALPLANHVGLACVFALIAACELLRLRLQLREQREFDALFYG